MVKCQYFIFMHFFSISPQNNITYPNVCMDIISLSTKYVFMVVSSLSIQITLFRSNIHDYCKPKINVKDIDIQ